jgi:hypothetical protein
MELDPRYDIINVNPCMILMARFKKKIRLKIQNPDRICASFLDSSKSTCAQGPLPLVYLENQ